MVSPNSSSQKTKAPHTPPSKTSEISISDLEQIKWSMVTISKEMENILNVCPKLSQIDLEELDDYYDNEKYLQGSDNPESKKSKNKRQSTRIIESLDENVLHIIRKAASIRTAWELKVSYNEGSLPILDSIVDFQPLPKYVSPYKPSASDMEKKSNDLTFWPPPLPEIRDKRLENQVFTHKSISNENAQYWNTRHNERLEFIGDAILNFTMSNIIYEWFPEANEGDLTSMRSLLACNSTLWDMCTMYGIDKNLDYKFDMVVEQEGKKSKIVADIMEAYIGALYTETKDGPSIVKEWLVELFKPMMRELYYQKLAEEPIDKEAKQRLYALIGIANVGPEYETVIEGDSENPFAVRCVMGTDVIGMGVGNSIKNAGLRAAMMALDEPKTIAKWTARRLVASSRQAKGIRPVAAASKSVKSSTPVKLAPKAELYLKIGSLEQRPTYNCIPFEGEFKAKVSMFNDFLGEGTGRTKKEAENNAAQDALRKKNLIAKWAVPTKSK